MKDDEQYLKAWTDEEEKKGADPVVSAVKAARQADADAFADAFKNDKFEEPAVEKRPEGETEKAE